MSTILVTGATGTTGSEVVKQLSARGAGVRAFVRDLKKAAGHEGPAVELVQGDMSQPATLEAALQGVERVFLVSPAHPRQVELQGNVIEASQRAGVRHIVKVATMETRLDSPVLLSRMHAQTERQLEASGIAYTHLHPTLFMQSFLSYIPTIKSEGAIYAPLKGGRVGMVDARDVASVAVAALTEDGYYGRTCEITGPEALSFGDAAGTLSEVLGKPVRYVDVPPAVACKSMLEAGIEEWLVNDLLLLMEYFSTGQAAVVTSTIASAARIRPHTFRDFVRDYASMFRD
jgi:uncharacterized protein YbjT (DUF2867 family)